MTTRVLKCTFPFPAQTPPVQVAHPCEQCPNASRAVLDLHATLEPNDPELLAAIADFAGWFFAVETPPRNLEEHFRYAADLYTRPDHTGTCIPKTLLFAYYKLMQLDSYSHPPELSEQAQKALKGMSVPSWPDGIARTGRTWNELFAEYNRRYE